ncbi:EAL domain-containing protein [Methylophilus methylotrophus]|uniref:bifunctional diguanylate cyclase/phosphodiesterase n=1 Tax=Methylophilus methylotrophus TaxID=17 RepID=UPI00233E59D8|nr:EAL domain-containing protein [Methylophilus methylotrophus]
MSAQHTTASSVSHQSVSHSGPLSIEEQTQLLNLQRAILKSIAQGAEHLEVIKQTCLLAESLLSNSFSSVMLMDDHYQQLNVYVAPSLTPEQIQKINGLRPSPGGGSCGNVIYQKTVQYVSNTFTDERWEDIRHLAHEFDVRACWSIPIFSAENKVIGTFALSSFEHREPSLFHRMLLEIGSSIIGIALNRNHYQESLRQFEKVFEGSEQGIMVTDTNLKILSVNPAFTKVLGYSIDDVKGKTPKMLSSGLHDQHFYRAMWESITHFGHWRGEVWNRRKNGEIFPEWLSISEVRNELGDITHYVGTFSDISDLKSAQKEIQYLSSHDALTGLPDIALFKDRLETAISIAAPSNRKIGLLALNLDNFKFLNDSLGYASGDKLLKLFAERLKGCLHETDAISRHGGDEFIILLNNIHDDDSINYMVDMLLTEVSSPFAFAGRNISTSCSIGVAVYPTDGHDFEKLFGRARKAMSQAKEEGRNTARFFTEKLNTDSLHYLNIAYGLREALAHHQFELHYQPQISLKDAQVIGAEALIRWHHPQNGMQPPVQFISIAEQTGLIVEMGEWIIEEACRQGMQWQKNGLPPLSVAVNVSAVQFRRGNLDKVIIKALEKTGLNPQLLELELTESILLEDIDHLLAQLDGLKKLGVKLAIDDFGTGYSSLAYLKKFNIDRLKIDQSFVRDINTDPNDAAIVRAIVQMAHTLNLEVIAEGVEDEAMLKHLRESGCDEVQGYLFSKPLPADAFEAFIKNSQL